ncbi:MAG: helix-hairpin-helix domain-containing protein [Gammaproteobacteria bacterium]|nr:helix-hairpin-helix domain-containing protein [Gammaproteobacteria bacterium]
MHNKLNEEVAEMLYEIGDLLEQQGAESFRCNAYRRAADTVEQLAEDLQSLFDREGIDGLVALPNIGKGISRSIVEILQTGRSSRLENLRGTLEPEKLFQTIPGIGAKLAHQIHTELQAQTLEALELAAHDGRLEKVPGVGHRRATSIRASLANMLGRRIHRPATDSVEPSVDLLLSADEEYRQKSEQDKLPKITPRRFNPEGEAWLPILHTTMRGWHFTVLYSNTARAHDLGRTHDWVVIYDYDEHHHESQHTVVTETRGPLVGKRVVRGRELECREYYSGL